MEHSTLIFWIGTIIFIGTYVLIASEKVHKTVAALLGAMLMLIVILPGPGHSGGSHEEAAEPVAVEAPAAVAEQVPAAVAEQAAGAQAKAAEALAETEQALADATGPSEIERKAGLYDKLDTFARYSNFDVVFTLAGMMLLVNLLSGTGLFQYVAIRCAKLAKGLPIRTMILLVFATAFLSAFLDNVTTILLVAPVTLLVCNELDVPPVPFLMAETMASNIGGTATLIGDPPNLIIGSIADLNFMDFLMNLTPFILVLMVIYCICLWGYYSKRMRVTVEKRAQVLGILTRAHKGLCVAGTHGKTTTSAMCAHIMHQSHVDCNAFLGGIAKNYSSNYILSKESDYVVIEADEFDRSFHWLRPWMSVITSADPDHLDIYGTKEAYLESFNHYTELIQPGGALIIHTGLEVEPRVQDGVKVYTYGRAYSGA